MNKIYCLPPIITGDETKLLGNGDLEVPDRSFPYDRRRQENQGRTNRCVFYMWAEILENKVFNTLGRWYMIPEDEILRIWNKAKKAGLASESNGAYMNAPLKMMEDGEIITMVDVVSGDSITVTQNNWYVVANRADARQDYIDKILKEVSYNGGVMCGVNTKQARLGYLEANDKPYIINKNNNPKAIAHATGLTAYDLINKPNRIATSGTYGENFGNEGVLYYQLDDLWSLFTPLGFMINIRE